MKNSIDTPPIGTPKHDLVSSARTPDKPHNWEQGIVFVQEPIAGTASSGRVIIQGVTTKSAQLTQNSSYMGTEYEPFLIEVGVSRQEMSYSPEEQEAIARRVMERTERRIIEQRMLLGTPGTTNMFLADPTTTTTIAGTNSAIQAVAIIQTGFADAGGMGTIYVSPRVVEQMQGLLDEDSDGRLRTKIRGDLVIVGTYGVNGPWPQIAGAGTSWVFGHLGEPELFLSDAMVFDAYDQTTNTPTVRVEKVAAVVWNPGQWATLATIT